MRGIDVIEALNDIDDKLLQNAKPHRRAAPFWLKYSSMAACICCVLLMSFFALTRLANWGDDVIPETLASVPEAEASASSLADSAEIRAKVYSATNADKVDNNIKDAFVNWIAATDGFMTAYGGDDWRWSFTDISEDCAVLHCYSSGGDLTPQSVTYDNGVITWNDGTVTTEDLDAMGGLGTTVYMNRDDAGNAAEEDAAAPAADVVETVPYGVTEEQLVTAEGICLGMSRSDILEILGTPDTEDPLFLRYGNTHYTLTQCDICGDPHLSSFGVDGESEVHMPFGFDYGTSLDDVLSYFDAADAQPQTGYELYRLDDTHYAYYEPLAETGLVTIRIFVGDIICDLSFGRDNTIVYNNIWYSSSKVPCPNA